MGISLCMIVKNEEDWIENALGSVRTVVDEIIIADTGSTDNTIKRASRFSLKVLHFKWKDSFADARNFTLAEARHPWILVLDADECIAARDLPLINEAIQRNTDGYYLIQRDYVFGNQIVGWTSNSGSYEEGKTYPGYLDNRSSDCFVTIPIFVFKDPSTELWIHEDGHSHSFRQGRTLPFVRTRSAGSDAGTRSRICPQRQSSGREKDSVASGGNSVSFRRNCTFANRAQGGG
jgi:glycosyltransferase involved in cell wall biosynthesis